MRIFLHVFFFCLVGSVFAQTKIEGYVKDKKAKPIRGVNITLKDTYDGATTDSTGYYSFTTAEKGSFVLVFEAPNYESWEQQINLTEGTQKVNMVLRQEINELTAVTITAGSFEASDNKRASVLKPLDIVTTAGANADISATLQTLPGAQRVGESEGLFIRGGSAEESKIIIDGTVVNKFFFSSVPGIAQRGRFSPFLFSNTAFSSGGYSALYGQALSAVLNLESVDIPQKSEAQFGIAPLFTSAGFQKVNEKKNFSFGSSYSYSNLTLYFLMIKQKQDFFNPPTSHNLDFNMRYKFKKGIIKWYAYLNHSELGLRSNSIDSVGLKNLFSLKNTNFFTNISYKHILKNNWKLYSVASFSYNDDQIAAELQNQTNERVPLTNDPYLDGVNFKLRAKESMSQARAVMEKKLKKMNAVRFGGEVWYVKNHSDFEFYYANFSLPFDEVYSAAFVESDIYLSNKLAFRPGIRYEYSDMTVKSNVAPRLSLSYLLAKPTQLTFDYGIFYQSPERKYFANGSDPTKLKYQRADHYILTFQHLTADYTFRAQVFDKEYTNLIKTDPSNQFAINSDGYGYARGVEVFWRDRKSIKGLDYWVSYSYLDTKRDYLNYPMLAQPTFAAAHTGSFVLKKFWVKRMFGINWSFNWATGRPYFNPNKPSTEFLTDRTPFYSVNNFSFNWITKIKKSNAVVVLGVNNVFNQQQVFTYTYSNRLTDSNGNFVRDTTTPPARMSFFVGLFMSFGVDRTQESINNNL